MSSICAEHHHQHFYPLFSLQKTLQEINLPPRKLLSRRSKLPISISPHDSFHHFIDEEPRTEIHNFLPCNGENEEEEEKELDPYASDEFRMYEFKVRRCMRSRSHDWTDCPFAHPGEKARRRDPRRFHYSGNPCSDFRRGGCPRGDSCEFAHGVFECWLHPARYRTHACKDGRDCKRKVCFFAHSPREVRVLPCTSQSASSSISISPPSSKHCCVFCHSVASSPTSTLVGFTHSSPPTLSPPLSPNTNVTSSDVLKGGYSLIPRLNEASKNVNSVLSNQSLTGYLSYKNALMELVSSLEAIDISTAAAAAPTVNGNHFSGAGVSPKCEDDQQFILSPPISKPIGSRDFFNEDGLINNGGLCPDLEWVNELVM